MSCCNCSSNLGQQQKTVIIKNPKSGLVLDATDYPVKVQSFNGGCAQLWTLECIDHGRFVIINKGNGKILKIEHGAIKSAKLITYQRTPGFVHDNEQWHISGDGTIMCPAAGKLVLDIPSYSPGTTIIAYPKHGKDNQIFQIEYK